MPTTPFVSPPSPTSSDEYSESRPPSEVDSLEDIFQYIDSWAGQPEKGGELIENFSIDKTYVGSNVSKAFQSIMFDGDGGELLTNRYDNLIAWGCFTTKASHWYQRLRFLVSYLESGKGTQKIRHFIEEIRGNPEASSYWQITSNKSEFNVAWQALWLLLNFSHNIEIKSNTFQGQIHQLFPVPSRRVASTANFDISLKDLENVDLSVKPTSLMEQHLLIEGNTLYILKTDFEEVNMLLAYKHNKAAKALGIASLGDEIVSSLHALFVKDEFWSQASTAGLLSSKSDVDRILCETFLRNADHKVRPQVLAVRAHTLRKLVDYRRSWWPSLVRDIKKQIEAEPVLFYGFVLAIFFGICTVIQTIASVWSLVLALRAAK